MLVEHCWWATSKYKRSLCVNLVMKTLCQFQVYDKMVIKERDTLKLAEISIFVLVTVKLSSFGNCHFTEAEI